MPNKPFLNIDNITAAYHDKHTVVDKLSFKLNEGELACLLGPSGCGKTTVLRAISGFQSLRSGSISLDGTTLSQTSGGIPPENRNVGMVSVSYTHLTLPTICSV